MSVALHQASCVAIGGRGVLIEGPPGSGKSSLALAMIDRTAVLVGDDGVQLEMRDGALWALPPPNTAGLMEIRNVGRVQMDCQPAPLALVIALDPVAPRFRDDAEETVRAGFALPLIRLWPYSPVLALRAEWALRRYGC